MTRRDEEEGAPVKAMMLARSADGSHLELMEVPEPQLGPGQVAIQVSAASVNRADLLQRAGTYLPGTGPGVIPAGIDAAGEVTAVGEAVESVRVGDRVMTMATGGLAEQVVVDADMAVPLPAEWSPAEGAAAIVGLMTQHNALHTAARLSPGESVLVHAATAGVGLQAVQLARFLGAGTVFASTRSSRAVELLRRLGADHVIDVSRQRFEDRVLEVTREEGVAVIIDHVGGPYLAGNVACAAVRGRLVSVGRLGGGEGTLDMEVLAFKRLEILGVTFRTRDAQEKAEIAFGVRRLLERPGAAEALRPTVDRTLPWTQTQEAHDLMAANAHLGKLVLEVSSAGGGQRDR